MRRILAARADGADATVEEKCTTLLAEARATFTFSRPLAACFSRAIDSLSQWRGYGGGQMRFALEFDEAALRATAGEQHFDFVDCIYNEINQSSQITAIIEDELRGWDGPKRRQGIGRLIKIANTRRRYPGYDAAMEELKLSAKEKRPMSKEHAEYLHQMSSNWTRFQWELSKLLMRIKHPSFYAEAEVRAAAEVDEDRDLEFRGSERAIVPFIRLRFRNGEERGALRAVRVGPGSEYAEVKPLLEQLLFQNFYDGVTVRHTDCTYRD